MKKIIVALTVIASSGLIISAVFLPHRLWLLLLIMTAVMAVIFFCLPNKPFKAINEAQLLKNLYHYISTEKNRNIAVLSIDIDDFRKIHDTFGSETARATINHVYQTIDNLIQPPHKLYYRGDDEFIVVILGIDSLQMIEALAKQILKGVNRYSTNDKTIFLTVSIGISFYNYTRVEANQILSLADAACAQAKKIGKNSLHITKTAIATSHPMLIVLDEEMQYIFDRNELLAYYQPKVNINNNSIAGVEALLRWHRKSTNTIITPDEFIPIAEQNGLIVSMGEWILTTACRQLKTWQQAGIKIDNVSVNVSTRQLVLSNFPEKVKRILDETKLQPNCLELEITESLLLIKTPKTLRALIDLKALGIKLSIDDFGTGYSTLTYLSLFPFDKLKFDKYFIMDILSNEKHQIIVKNLIKITHDLGMRVVAEGVETVEQLDLLKKFNCEEVQGYYFSRPVPSEIMTQYIIDFNKFNHATKS